MIFTIPWIYFITGSTNIRKRPRYVPGIDRHNGTTKRPDSIITFPPLITKKKGRDFTDRDSITRITVRLTLYKQSKQSNCMYFSSPTSISFKLQKRVASVPALIRNMRRYELRGSQRNQSPICGCNGFRKSNKIYDSVDILSKRLGTRRIVQRGIRVIFIR